MNHRRAAKRTSPGSGEGSEPTVAFNESGSLDRPPPDLPSLPALKRPEHAFETDRLTTYQVMESADVTELAEKLAQEPSK